MPWLVARPCSTSAWASDPWPPAAPRTTASLSAGTRSVADSKSATSSASALIGGEPPRRAPPGGAAPALPAVRRFGGRSKSIYPSFEVSAGPSADLKRRGSTIPRLAPISPSVREIARSTAVRVWLPALAAAAASAAFDRRSDAGDLLYFVHRGERLLSAHGSSVYSDRELQAGPLQLLLAGAARSTEALAFVVELGVVALLLFVPGRLGVGPRWRVLAGLAAVVAGLAHGAFVQGHPAEALTPLLWVLAALEARRGRTVRAGALIGISGGLELWGLLGVPVLLLSPRLRDTARGFATASVVIAAQLAPFVLFGTFRMLDYEWRVARGTPLSFVLAPGTHFGWPLRVLQAAVACGLGGLLARRL